MRKLNSLGVFRETGSDDIPPELAALVIIVCQNSKYSNLSISCRYKVEQA